MAFALILRRPLTSWRPLLWLLARRNWHSDIQWISAADEDRFEMFQSAFDSLGIGTQAAPYLDLDKQGQALCRLPGRSKSLQRSPFPRRLGALEQRGIHLHDSSLDQRNAIGGLLLQTTHRRRRRISVQVVRGDRIRRELCPFDETRPIRRTGGAVMFRIWHRQDGALAQHISDGGEASDAFERAHRQVRSSGWKGVGRRLVSPAGFEPATY